MSEERLLESMEGSKGNVRLDILQYMRRPTTDQLYAFVMHFIPSFAKAMLFYTNSENPLLRERNSEIPTVLTPCFLNRQKKPNTLLFPYGPLAYDDHYVPSVPASPKSRETVACRRHDVQMYIRRKY